MRRYILLYISLCASLSVLSQSLSARLDVLLGDALLHAADASVAVYDLTDDSLLYEHRADKLCRPASVEKVVTTVAALNPSLPTSLRFILLTPQRINRGLIGLR